MAEPIISIPKTGEENKSGENKSMKFGYFETQNSNYRKTQEDALTWEQLDPSDLNDLNPQDIAKRLWTTYKVLDKDFLEQNDKLKKPNESGTTASTTVYDGKGNLITATLADAASFAAVYDKKGNIKGVVRLNSRTHKPTDEDEKNRVISAGGDVRKIMGAVRVNFKLAVSRAIGDSDSKFGDENKEVITSEATTDIITLDEIARKSNVDVNEIGKIQVITTCDGFTDGAGKEKQEKEDHEGYLFNALKGISPNLSEIELSEKLVEQAKTDMSKDNISVAIQTITKDTPAFILGVYDGHGGSEASNYVANNIGEEFKEQLALSPENYAEQDLSVDKNNDVYERDNKGLNEIVASAKNPLTAPDSTINRKSQGAKFQQFRKMIKEIRTAPPKMVQTDSTEKLPDNSVLSIYYGDSKYEVNNRGYGNYTDVLQKLIKADSNLDLAADAIDLIKKNHSKGFDVFKNELENLGINIQDADRELHIRLGENNNLVLTEEINVKKVTSGDKELDSYFHFKAEVTTEIDLTNKTEKTLVEITRAPSSELTDKMIDFFESVTNFFKEKFEAVFNFFEEDKSNSPKP